MEQRALSPFIRVPNTITELLAAGASVPIGSKGKVYVDGYNDMPTKQKMGIRWVVKDPEGYVAEAYYYPGIDWTFEYVDPDDDHRFYGDQFDLDKVGPYTIAIELFMNQDSPVVVDDYAGVLCVVEAEIYAGHISLQELHYDGVEATIPVL